MGCLGHFGATAKLALQSHQEKRRKQKEEEERERRRREEEEERIRREEQERVEREERERRRKEEERRIWIWFFVRNSFLSPTELQIWTWMGGFHWDTWIHKIT